MAADLREAARRCAETAGVRAVLITGEGPVFTVGGDIEVFASAEDAQRPALLRGMATEFHEALRRLISLEVPVVSAVHGAVAGGGLGLLYCADLVLAAEGTKFAVAFGGLGVSSDGGTSWFLPRLVGARRAAQLYFEGRVLSAEEATEWGLVSRTVPAAELAEEASALARRLAVGPTRGYGEMRRLLRDSWDRDVLSHFNAEEAAVARSFSSADATEAVSAFLSKRPADFQGR
jgi:2-(1,2-epoxy-1,2-dihydrophenyl)acetyl-CoA isomerase